MKKIWQITLNHSLWLNPNGLTFGIEFLSAKNRIKITVPFLCLQFQNAEMPGSNFTDDDLKLYLLDLTGGAEREEIEIWMRSDARSAVRLERIEDEIIEDYLDNILPPGMMTIVEAHFSIQPERREKMRIGELLHVFTRPIRQGKNKTINR